LLHLLGPELDQMAEQQDQDHQGEALQ